MSLFSGNAELINLPTDLLKKRFLCHYHFPASEFMRPGSRYLKRTALPTHHEQCVAVETTATPGPSSAPDEMPSPPLKVRTPKRVYGKHEETLATPGPSSAPDDQKPSTSGQHDLSPNTRDFLENIANLPTPESKRRRVKRKLIYSDDAEGLVTPKRRRIRQLQQTVARHGVLLTRKRAQIAQLKSTLEKYKCREDILQCIPYRSRESKALVTMQILHKRNAAWNRDEKDFAISLYYKSPATYKFLRRKNIVLPAVSTIQRWISVSKCLPGFSPVLFHQIKVKASTMSTMEKMCVVCVDEMAIKECLEYSPLLDLIEGYEDLGVCLGRTNKTAKKALVFMARGMYSKWKLPLGYFLSNKGLNGNTLATVIKNCIDKLAAATLTPLALVCDQGSTNVSAIKILGGTIEKPFFVHNSIKVYTIYDPPHLMKSLRNNLLNGYFVYEGKTVRFQDVIDTYNIDKASATARMLTKITDAHISPNAFEKMNCKLALQIFSRTMAAALRTCYSTGEVKSVSALNTAEFIEMIDKTFDCLNSQSRFSNNPHSCAISQKKPIVAETLISTRGVMKVIKKINFNGKNLHVRRVSMVL